MTVSSLRYWKDVLLQASGNSAAQLIGVAGIPILTRLYSPEFFAVQGVFIQLVMLFAALVTLRYEYFTPLLSDESEYRLMSSWLLRTGLSIALVLCSILILFEIYGFWEWVGVVSSSLYVVAPFTAFLISVSYFYQFEAQRRNNFKKSAIAEVSSKVCYVFSGTVLSVLASGAGLIMTTAFGALGKILVLRQLAVPYAKGDFLRAAPVISRFRARSSAMVFSNIVLSVSSALPVFYIGSNYGENNLGQFTLVMATIFLPSGLIGAAVGNVFYQRAAVLWSEREFMVLTDLWASTISKLLLGSLPIFVLIYMVSPWAYPFVFGDEWRAAGQMAQALCVASLFAFIAGPLDRLTIVINVSWYLPLVHLLRLALIVILVTAFNQSLQGFLFVYSVLMSVVYALDIMFARVLLWLRSSECN